MIFCNYIFDSFRAGSHVAIIYTDFSKAFNSINHDFLISLLSISEFGDPHCLVYVLIYPKDHNELNSLVLSPPCPLIFTIFVNNANYAVLFHRKIIIKFYCKVSSIEDCNYLKRDIDCLVTWGDCLGLSFNVSKYKLMTFSRG